MCGSMADIPSAAAEIRRAKKEEERRNRMKIYMVSLFHRATINLGHRQAMTIGTQVCPSVLPYVHKKYFRFPSNLVCG